MQIVNFNEFSVKKVRYKSNHNISVSGTVKEHLLFQLYFFTIHK